MSTNSFFARRRPTLACIVVVYVILLSRTACTKTADGHRKHRKDNNIDKNDHRGNNGNSFTRRDFNDEGGAKQDTEYEDIASQSEIMKKLTHFYNKQDPPTLDKPTSVKLGIYVNSFHSFNEQTMDYSVSMYLRQAWNDPRLAFARTYRTKIDKIRLGENSWNDIWVPDTFFRNEKAASFHEVTAKNRLMTVTGQGDLWYVIKISATLSCPMKLHKYPLDTQTCPMMFESFGYNMDTVYFSWLESPVEIDPGMQLPQFELVDRILYDCSQNYTAGAFPCLEIRFVLRRDIGYFLIQVYVPSVLIVILSWVSFWINVEASPARVSLGLLTVLTTTTMSGGARASLPRVSYIKALDVWMIVCLVFNFASLIEYAIVNVLSRRPSRPPAPVATAVPSTSTQTGNAGVVSAIVSGQVGGGVSVAVTGRRPLLSGCNRPDSVCPKSPRLSIQTSVSVDESTTLRTTKPSQPEVGSQGWSAAARLVNSRMQRQPAIGSRLGGGSYVHDTLRDGKQAARRVDKFSRVAFPLSFLLFNIVYWVFYSRTAGGDGGGSEKTT